MNDNAQDGYLNTSASASKSQYRITSILLANTKDKIISKDKYVSRSAINLNLDTKKEFDDEREKRIQLYTKRWENGFECISGKPMPGTLDKCTGLVIDRANQSYGSGEDDID